MSAWVTDAARPPFRPSRALVPGPAQSRRWKARSPLSAGSVVLVGALPPRRSAHLALSPSLWSLEGPLLVPPGSEG